MPNPQTLLLHLLLPAALTAGALLLVSGAWRKPSVWAVRAAWAVALPLGYAVGHYRVFGLPQLDRLEARDWLMMMAGAMAVLQALVAMMKVRGKAAVVLAALPIVFTPLLVLQYLGAWSQTQWLGWSAGLALAGLGLTLGLRQLEAHGDVGLPIGLGVCALAWGVFVWASGAMHIGQLSMTLGGAIAGGCAACFALPREYRHVGSASITALLLIGQLLLGYFYVYGMDDPTSDRWIRTVIIAASPLIMWLPQFVWPRDTRPVGRVVFIAVLLALVVGPPAREYYEQVVGDNAPPAGSAWDTHNE